MVGRDERDHKSQWRVKEHISVINARSCIYPHSHPTLNSDHFQILLQNVPGPDFKMRTHQLVVLQDVGLGQAIEITAIEGAIVGNHS